MIVSANPYFKCGQKLTKNSTKQNHEKIYVRYVSMWSK